MFRMLVLVCVHCGESTSVQMLNFILMHSKTNETLNLFVQMQSEIEFYHHNVLQETIKKCFTSVNHSSATVKPSMVRFPLFHLFNMFLFIQLHNRRDTTDNSFTNYSTPKNKYRYFKKVVERFCCMLHSAYCLLK